MAKKNKEENKITVAKIIKDLEYAYEKRKDWITAAKKDFEYVLGEQWDEEDVQKLADVGVKAMTINKCQVQFFLLSGIQRQTRSDFMGYPKGEEDQVKSDISTRLIKNVMESSEGEYKMSEQFEDGVIGGEGFLEGYIDYSNDLLNGEMKFDKLNPFLIFPHPAFKEYDCSDAKFIIKIKLGLSADQLYKLFPGREKEIDEIAEGNLAIDKMSITAEGTSSPTPQEKNNYGKNEGADAADVPEKTYDLIEYYYIKQIPKFYVIDKKLATVKAAKDESEADSYIEQMKQLTIKEAIQQKVSDTRKKLLGFNLPVTQSIVDKATQEVYANPPENTAMKITKTQPEVWIASTIGSSEFLDDHKCWCSPRWNKYPIFRFAAHWITTPIKKREYMVKGIMRDMICPQDEINKRSTQELRHLNSTANSGWKTPVKDKKSAWIDPEAVKTYGSSPGVNLEWDVDIGEPQRIQPAQLSLGHEQLIQNATRNLIEISGINTDLLALREDQSSGRAINLRQKQGLVMIQRMFDNFGRTRKNIGRFILSQLGELFTVETAVKVIGESYIQENFAMPVMMPAPDPANPGQMKQKPQIDDAGNLIMSVNPDAVGNTFNAVLNDAALNKYDIGIGEGIYSETARYANYSMLLDMAGRNIPIPPELLIDESMLSPESKNKIKKIIAQRQAAIPGAGNVAAPGAPPAK